MLNSVNIPLHQTPKGGRKSGAVDLVVTPVETRLTAVQSVHTTAAARGRTTEVTAYLTADEAQHLKAALLGEEQSGPRFGRFNVSERVFDRQGVNIYQRVSARMLFRGSQGKPVLELYMVISRRRNDGGRLHTTPHISLEIPMEDIPRLLSRFRAP